MNTEELPVPECQYGYPWSQLTGLLTFDEAESLRHWMWGQTMSLCDDHGTVVYSWDLMRFLDGLPIID